MVRPKNPILEEFKVGTEEAVEDYSEGIDRRYLFINHMTARILDVVSVKYSGALRYAFKRKKTG